MQTIFFNGTPCHTYGNIPAAGEKGHCYHLVDQDLTDFQCSKYAGKRVVLNIFPSLDTPVCATTVRRFNKEAAALEQEFTVLRLIGHLKAQEYISKLFNRHTSIIPNLCYDFPHNYSSTSTVFLGFLL